MQPLRLHSRLAPVFRLLKFTPAHVLADRAHSSASAPTGAPPDTAHHPGKARPGRAPAAARSRRRTPTGLRPGAVQGPPPHGSLLCAAIQRERLIDLQLEQLLEDAESVSLQVLEAQDPLMPITRGKDTGPWDVSEAGSAGISLTDLGGLKIPMPSDRDEIRMEAGDGGAPVAVTVVHGSTALQLQAFRSSAGRNWSSVHSELGDSIKASGGEAKEWRGPAGIELRVDLPVAKPSGRMQVRMLGCDGPGWLLRGIVSGDGAAPDSRDMWAYNLFSDTVVSPAGCTCGGVVICLRSPEN